MNLQRSLYEFILLTFVFTLAMCIGFAATTSGPGVNSDAAVYISMGANIHRGLGFVTDITEANSPLSYRPVTTWPPAYSILIAGLMNFGLDAVEAARWSSILSFGVLGCAVYWLGHVVAGRAAGMLASLSTILLMPVARTATFALTEITFIAFSVLAIVGMVQFARSAEKTPLLWLVVSGVFTALTILTRYVGGIWLLVGLFIIFLVTIKAWKRWLASSILFGTIALLPALPWFIRNARLTGQFSGMDRSVGYHPMLSENLRYFIGTYARDLIPPMHLGIRGIVQSVPFYGWLLLLAVGTGTIIWLWHVGVGRFLYNTAIRVQTDFKQWQEPFFLWTVVFIYAFGYAAVIFLLSNRSLFPAYDWPRYLTPTYPLILILWSTGWVALFKVISYGWPNWSRSLAVALPTLLWLLPYGNQTVGFIQQAAKGQEYTSVEWQQSQVIHELAAIISPDDRIYSDLWCVKLQVSTSSSLSSSYGSQRRICRSDLSNEPIEGQSVRYHFYRTT